MFIYVFACCSVNMLALMEVAFTQVLEMSLANAACSHSLRMSLFFAFLCCLHTPLFHPGSSAVMEQGIKMKCNNLKTKK